MAPPIQTTREAWIEAGLNALAMGGPDNVRVDRIAHSLGVTRGGFYGHFDGRPAFLTALLDTWEQAAAGSVIAQVDAGDDDARAKIRRAGELTFGPKILPVDLAVRDWARHDNEVATRLRRVDGERLAYLRRLFGEIYADGDEVEARSVLAFTLAIGFHFIAGHSPGRRRAALRLATDHLLR